ncbi:NUDIX hydrolase, partial [Streptomyces sp. A73]|nr:NUDIX hydrolase [Streptomyces sp. A73]
VAVRTVATWHKDPTIVPRSEIQQALDTLHEKAPESARRRFARLFRPPVDEVQPQALRVAIAVVVRDSQVLLVCRRG